MLDQLRQLKNSLPSQSFAQTLKARHADIYNWVLAQTDSSFGTFKERVEWLLNPQQLICAKGQRMKFVPAESRWGFCGSSAVCACHRAEIAVRAQHNTTFADKGFIEKRTKTWRKKYGVDNPQQLEEYRQLAKTRQSGKSHTVAVRDGYLDQGYEAVVSRIESAGFSALFGREEYQGSSRMHVYPWQCNHCQRQVLSHVDYGTEPRCESCNPKEVSSQEHEIRNYLTSLGLEFLTNDRTVIPPQELDIYLPSLNLAFEVNGIYWHSSQKKSATYHIDKTLACAAQGVKLIHIFETDWKSHQMIVKSRIRSLVGKDRRYYARKCQVRSVGEEEAQQFVNQHHLQGAVGSQIRLGLYAGGTLVALMTFGRPRYDKSADYELLRYCSAGTVVGGAGKLFSHFCRLYNPTTVVSYADRCWSQGNLYRALGFQDVTKDPRNVGYFYYKNNTVYHRSSLTKKILVSQGHDSAKTADQILEEQGYLKIYNCGNFKFLYSAS